MTFISSRNDAVGLQVIGESESTEGWSGSALVSGPYILKPLRMARWYVAAGRRRRRGRCPIPPSRRTGRRTRVVGSSAALPASDRGREGGDRRDGASVGFRGLRSKTTGVSLRMADAGCRRGNEILSDRGREEFGLMSGSYFVAPIAAASRPDTPAGCTTLTLAGPTVSTKSARV